jgi:hypothetical protein
MNPGAVRVFRDKNEIRIFALLLVVFGFFVSIGPGRTQGARVMAHAYALLHEGRNAIDTCHWNTIDKDYYGGHYYTAGGPGMGYLAVAPLAVFEAGYSLIPKRVTRQLDERMRTQLERQCQPLIEAGYLSFDPNVNRVDLFKFHASIWFFELFIALLMALSAVVYYRVLLLYGVEAGLSCQAAILLGLGTNLFFYSRIPYSVVPTAFLLLLAFYLLAGAAGRSDVWTDSDCKRLLGAGLALGIAVTLEYIQIIGAALIFLYAWQRVGSKRVWLVALGGIPMGLLIMLYHFAAFGDPFAVPYKYLVPIFAPLQAQGFVGLAAPSWGRMAALTFGLRRGLFIYSPVLLLATALIVRDVFLGKRRVAECVLVLALSVAYLVFQAATPAAGETWGIGPRYAAVIVPFLMLGFMFLKGAFERRVFYCFAWLSFAINLLLVQRDIEAMHSQNPLWDATRAFLCSGPSSTLLEQGLSLTTFSIPLRWSANVLAYAVLAGIVALIWRKTSPSSALPETP